jgi:hypothetical protein
MNRRTFLSARDHSTEGQMCRNAILVSLVEL